MTPFDGFAIVFGNGERAGKPDPVVVRASRATCEALLPAKHPHHRIIPVRVIRLDTDDDLVLKSQTATTGLNAVIGKLSHLPMPIDPDAFAAWRASTASTGAAESDLRAAYVQGWVDAQREVDRMQSLDVILSEAEKAATAYVAKVRT